MSAQPSREVTATQVAAISFGFYREEEVGGHSAVWYALQMHRGQFGHVIIALQWPSDT